MAPPTGGSSDSLTGVVVRNAPGQPLFPLDKGKGRIEEIKYPGESEYLKSSVQNALYRPPFWCPGFVSRHFDLLHGPST